MRFGRDIHRRISDSCSVADIVARTIRLCPQAAFSNCMYFVRFEAGVSQSGCIVVGWLFFWIQWGAKEISPAIEETVIQVGLGTRNKTNWRSGCLFSFVNVFPNIREQK